MNEPFPEKTHPDPAVSPSSSAPARKRRRFHGYLPPKWVAAILLAMLAAIVLSQIFLTDNEYISLGLFGLVTVGFLLLAAAGRLYGFPLIVCGALTIVLLRHLDLDSDQRMIAILIVGFITLMTVWIRGILRYHRSPAAVAAVVGAPIAAIGLFFGLFRIEHVEGNLVPHFTWRFAPPRDAALENPAASRETAAVLTPEKPGDFPEFLGPGRRPVLEGVGLATDWAARPPKLLWRQPIGAGWSSFAAVNGYALTMEQRGPWELVTCYEVKTGKPVWSHGVETRHDELIGGPGPRATPTVYKGYVYAQGGTGIVRCLNGADGTLVWSCNLPEMFGVPVDADGASQDGQAIAWGRSGSPLLIDDMVVLPAGGPKGGPYTSLVALDYLTGREIWRAGDDQISYASPTPAVLKGTRQILGVNEGTVAGYDVRTGRQLWSHPWPGHSNADATVSQPVAVALDRVFLSKGYGLGSALIELTGGPDRFQARELWRQRRYMKTKFTNVVFYRNCIFGLDDGRLECIDLETGEKRWKEGRYGQGQILRVDDLLLVQGEQGEVILCRADPERFEELGRFQALDEKTWNNLCLYDRRYLLVRNAVEAACYELPLE